MSIWFGSQRNNLDSLQPSTFENLVPDYTDFDKITETVIFPSSGSGPGGIGGSGGGGVKFDHSLWQEARNGTGIWSTGEIQTHNFKYLRFLSGGI